MRKCWNWQTGKTKDLVSVTTCGFKSHLPQIKRTSNRMSFFIAEGDLYPACFASGSKSPRAGARSGRRRSEVHRTSCAPSSAGIKKRAKPYCTDPQKLDQKSNIWRSVQSGALFIYRMFRRCASFSPSMGSPSFANISIQYLRIKSRLSGFTR